MSAWALLQLMRASLAGQPEALDSGNKSLDEELPDPAALRSSDPQDIEIVVDTPAPRDGAEQVLEREQALERAGTQGDVVAAARTLPGVARGRPSSGELSLWGALPQHSRRTIEDIPVPRLFHWGLSRSVLPASQIASLRIEPVAFAPAYGRAIGGLAQVRLSNPLRRKDQRLHSQIDLSLLEGALALEQAMTTRWAWSAALRHSLQRQVLGGVIPKSRRALYPLADNFDYQLSAINRIRPDTQLALRVFGAQSRQRIARASSELARQFAQSRRDHFHRFALTLDQRQEQQDLRALAWFGLQARNQRMDWQGGRLQASRGRNQLMGGIRLASSRWLLRQLKLDIGLDLEWERGEYEQRGSLTLPAREGDRRVWGQAPGPEYNEDQWILSRIFMAPYAGLTAILAEQLSLSAGLRMQSSATSGNRQWPQRPTDPAVGFLSRDLGWSPRVAIKWTRSRWDHWSLRAGIHRQLAAPQDLSPRFGNPMLEAQRAYQLALATNLFPLPGLRSDWTFFWNQQRDLVTRSALLSPPVTKNLLNQGQGRNFGAQTQLRYDLAERYSFIAHYSLTFAQKKDHPLAKYRPNDLAQRHQAQALASMAVNRHWKLSARLQWSSGFVRTPVIGAQAVGDGTTFEPRFGELNQDSLPNFFSASFRAAYEKSWGSSGQSMIRVWLDVQNISNHPNVEEFSYSYDYRRRDNMPGLPIFPTLGLTVKR